MKFKQQFMLPLMNQETGGEPQGGGGGGAPAGEPPATNLPSDPAPATFSVNPEDLQDGKFGGKWSSPTEMADYIKNIEDKHANLVRDIANNTKQTDEEIATAAEQTKQKQKQDATIRELAPAFIENGMVVTDEIKAALLETGLTEMEIKVGAYELKEALDKNASYVGGQENYDIIMEYHAQNMTPEEKVAFNHSIQNPNHSQALMVGLQTMYEKSLAESGDEQPSGDRFRGDNINSVGIKPYESKSELLKDKRYADSRSASSADKEKYRQRLAVTPDKVWR